MVSGGASGIDASGELFAELKPDMLLKKFPAQWNKYGKKAGHIRNGEMAEYADALLLIWDGSSPGSKNMRKQMLALDKPIYEIIIKKTIINEKNVSP